RTWLRFYQLFAAAGGPEVGLPSACARMGEVSPNGDSVFLRHADSFPFCEARRLPPEGRYVGLTAMHSNTAGGATHEDRASHRSSRRRGGSRTPHRAGAGAAAIAVAGLLAGCQSLMPRPAETAAAPTLISPLASAVIGDPRRVVPPPLD